MPVYVCQAVRCGGWIPDHHAFCSWHWSRLEPYLREIVSVALMPGERASAYTGEQALEIARVKLAVADGHMRSAEAERRLKAAAGFRAGRG